MVSRPSSCALGPDTFTLVTFAPMFGIYRYLLAIAVVFSHLWRTPAEYAGMYAVFAFYALSGYLMALVLTKTYGFSAGGTARFLANRALRIFPPYLSILALSLAVAFLLPELARELNPVMVVPGSASSWLRNIAILGLNGFPERLVPSAWSLHVELVFYVAMALVLARTRWMVVLWFLASVVYAVYAFTVELDIQGRYYSVFAASLPFSLGALAFHHRDLLRRLPRWHLLPAIVLTIGVYLFAGALLEDPLLDGLILAVLSGAYLLACLSAVDVRAVPAGLSKLDRYLGDLAYPVFLCHWPVGVTMMWAFGLPPRTAALFLVSLPLINLVGWAVHELVERRVGTTRSGIRKAAARGS